MGGVEYEDRVDSEREKDVASVFLCVDWKGSEGERCAHFG